MSLELRAPTTATSPLSVVILAAGKGTRMRSSLPKVMHRMAHRTLIGHVLSAAAALEASRVVAVLAPEMDSVRDEIATYGLPFDVAIQDPPLGTGHAVACALPYLPSEGVVLVLYGDTPLISAATLEALLSARAAHGAAVAVLGMNPPDPSGYGRLAFDDTGLAALVEERHASEQLKREGLCNSGVMAIDAACLRPLVDDLELRQEKNEYYLTDIVAGARARDWPCTATEGPWQDGVGVNSKAQLAAAEAIFQDRRRETLMAAGVQMVAPETVFLSADTVIEPDAVIEPFVIFNPGCHVERGALVHSFCHLERTRIGAGAEIGPFARLRPGADIGEGSKIGNFVEVKKATVEAGAKVNHLSYVGDARIGPGANVGAGTITCNYDGFGKYHTDIGAGAFIGSNTALVAPVRIGDGAIIGAGSTIAEDIGDDGLAVTRAELRVIEDGAKRFRARRKQD
ncbi:MAG: bifunctional UDP-N-acetylglucosamine diphosphorylase/glucosamine-1-phosphate N-acetyltransferase GlmU [Geminicoccaceae bacterium]